jgi:hypothetical protein
LVAVLYAIQFFAIIAVRFNSSRVFFWKYALERLRSMGCGYAIVSRASNEANPVFVRKNKIILLAHLLLPRIPPHGESTQRNLNMPSCSHNDGLKCSWWLKIVRRKDPNPCSGGPCSLPQLEFWPCYLQPAHFQTQDVGHPYIYLSFAKGHSLAWLVGLSLLLW